MFEGKILGSWDNTELRSIGLGMAAMSSVFGAINASFLAIRCLSEAQRVLKDRNLRGGAFVCSRSSCLRTVFS
jgi:hypothetical protein